MRETEQLINGKVTTAIVIFNEVTCVCITNTPKIVCVDLVKSAMCS